jgi:hypothetical protein
MEIKYVVWRIKIGEEELIVELSQQEAEKIWKNLDSSSHIEYITRLKQIRR